MVLWQSIRLPSTDANLYQPVGNGEALSGGAGDKRRFGLVPASVPKSNSILFFALVGQNQSKIDSQTLAGHSHNRFPITEWLT